MRACGLNTRRHFFPFFPLTERSLRPAFSDYAHFAFLSLCFFQCEVEDPTIYTYLHVTLPILHLGYSGGFVRPIVCLLPAESDSNSAYSAAEVAARRQNGVAVPHKVRRLEDTRRRCVRRDAAPAGALL